MSTKERIEVVERLVDEMGTNETAKFIVALEDVAGDLVYHNQALMRLYHGCLVGTEKPDVDPGSKKTDATNDAEQM